MKALTQKSFWIAIGVSLAFIGLILLSIVPQAFSHPFSALEAHEKFIYPIVRVTYGNAGGSGTVIYSQNGETYVLTNNHVICGAVRIVEEWSSEKQEDVKVEKRSVVYVEIFKYRNVSTPVGTMKVEADITAYNEDEDMAILKLRFEEPVQHVANLFPQAETDNIHVTDETIAVGCSLGAPPLPTVGILTRKNFLINSLSFHMSSAQIIYGNSGGGMFYGKTGEFIGVPSLVPVVGWGTPITHMGLFIPIDRIYQWFEKVGYKDLIPKSE
jgi:S1-C subfamily serine protease